ncbi:hypothetical protein BH09MYX1_BH09MYX1_31900 [soil metagenome]
MVKPAARWKGYAALAFVFVLGAAAGGGAVYSLAQKRHAAMLRDEGAFEGRRVNALSRKLDLDPDQKTKVSAILAKDREDSKVLGKDMVEKCGQPLRDHKADVDAQIRAVLRADQQTRFDQLVDERKGHAWVGGMGGMGGGDRQRKH